MRARRARIAPSSFQQAVSIAKFLVFVFLEGYMALVQSYNWS